MQKNTYFGANIYQKNKHLSMTFSQQMVVIFTNMLKRLHEAELYHKQKEYEKSSNLVKENIHKCSGLCEFLIDFFANNNNIQFAQVWFDFLITLMSDFVKLSVHHDPVLKNDIEKRLNWTIEMWKQCGESVEMQQLGKNETSQKFELNV
ncbi:MAG: hypothetical protein CNLJKLNK_00548 [Holosporales bacterium]